MVQASEGKDDLYDQGPWFAQTKLPRQQLLVTRKNNIVFLLAFFYSAIRWNDQII